MKFTIALLLTFCVYSASAWPEEWELKERSDTNTQMEFTLSLKQRNLDQLEDIFNAVSTPGNPEYGNYRTMKEVTELVSPPKFEQNLVVAFLLKNGIQAETFGDFIAAKGSVSAIEELFNVEIHTFESRITEGLVLNRAPISPTIPMQLRHIVVFVTGIFDFPVEKRVLQKHTRNEETDLWVVPQTLRELYDIPASATGEAQGNSMAVVEFAAVAGISMDDLATFNNLTDGIPNPSLDYTVGNFAFHPVVPADGESTLDVQYMMGVASGVPISFWTIDGWLYDFTTLVQQRLLRGLDVPLVFSISYDWAEGDQCGAPPSPGGNSDCRSLGGNTGYVTATDTNFMKIGATGITLLTSSGDAGAASKENLDCRSHNTPIQPTFPASSQYVTSVGGTMLQNGGVPLRSNLPPFCRNSAVDCAGTGSVEIVSSVPQALITSGGGFSNILSAPSYQSAAVSNWLNSDALQPPAGYFNATGRAYPDVAALAHKFMIVFNGRTEAVDGTSASAPITGGIIALINGERLAAGKPPVGFINNALYSAPSAAFNDITIGDITHTESPNTCATYGYGASPSWDPTTGFGTPVYSQWLSYFMSL